MIAARNCFGLHARQHAPGAPAPASRAPRRHRSAPAALEAGVMAPVAGTLELAEAEPVAEEETSPAPAAASSSEAAAALLAGPSAESSGAAEACVLHPQQPALVVFSGGTAFNSVAGTLRHLTTRVTHVLPVSDDGGSTAEVVRVLGGPAVGDIRSRCLRLADDSDAEAQAVRALLAHRLPAASAAEAKAEWYTIVEGDHPLWQGVSDPYKHTIRAFLVHFHANIMRHASARFDYRAGSVGNFFFAGARTFFRSLEAAIFLFSRVARLPEGSLVLPAVLTEERLNLGAEFEDGEVLVGQNQISHPSESGGYPREVDKACDQRLPAPIRRIFYLSSEGDTREHEVAPSPNPRALAEVARADAVVYAMGSLYTSLAPSLVLRGMGECIAARECPKIFILNGAHDRETSASHGHPGFMTAADMVQALTDALNRKHSKKTGQLDCPAWAYVSAVLVPEGGPIEVDTARLQELGVAQVQEVAATAVPGGGVHYDPDALVEAIAQVVHAHQQAQLPGQPQQRGACSEQCPAADWEAVAGDGASAGSGGSGDQVAA